MKKIALLLSFVITSSICFGNSTGSQEKSPRFLDTNEIRKLVGEIGRKQPILEHLSTKLEGDKKSKVLFSWKYHVKTAAEGLVTFVAEMENYLESIEDLTNRIERLERLTGKGIDQLSVGSEDEKIAVMVLLEALMSDIKYIMKEVDYASNLLDKVLGPLEYDVANSTELVAPLHYQNDFYYSAPIQQLMHVRTIAFKAHSQLTTLALPAQWNILNRVVDKVTSGIE